MATKKAKELKKGDVTISKDGTERTVQDVLGFDNDFNTVFISFKERNFHLPQDKIIETK